MKTRRLLLLLLTGSLLACSCKEREASLPPVRVDGPVLWVGDRALRFEQPIVAHRVSTPLRAAAVWLGDPAEVDPENPDWPTWAAEAVHLVDLVEGEHRVLPNDHARPTPRPWSPDGLEFAYALGNHGPVLQLRGRAEVLSFIAGESAGTRLVVPETPGNMAKVYAGVRWEEDGTLEVVAGCCGELRRYTLDAESRGFVDRGKIPPETR